MSYPTFDAEATAVLFAETMWVNRVAELAGENDGDVIKGQDPDDIVKYDSLSFKDKNDIVIFGRRNGVKVYDKGNTIALVRPQERADEKGAWFINIDVDKRYSEYLSGTVSDGAVQEVPAEWYETEAP